MPPTRHSNSTAHKESDQIPADQNYTLGDYSFCIERSSVPGSSNDKIEAICTDKDGKNARKSIQIPSSTQMVGWYVEANSDTASVYAKIKMQGLNPWNMPPFTPVVVTELPYSPNYKDIYSQSVFAIGRNRISATVAQSSFFTEDSGQGTIRGPSSWDYEGKTVYYMYTATNGYANIPIYEYATSYYEHQLAWQMVYGSFEDKIEEKLIARFAIDLEDAGGVGPGGGTGGGWIDPGDYDPDWEEGDPTHTLYVTVTGALSGRHNDPIEDPSYSYIPADKDTVKYYGCGGDGGHGGGGGAGASTVVIHKFATNQANYKEVTAIARRHGYGSGGGKGGEGGDGCILIYY